MALVTVEIFGKPGCHLCDVARHVLESVITATDGVELVERNILDNPEWFESMKNDIPVVVINGKRHAQWRVDADELRHAIAELLR